MTLKIVPAPILLNRISLALAERIVFPPGTGQWACVLGAGPCPPWAGLIWQPPTIDHALDVQVLWAFCERNDLSQLNWENTLRICHKNARPGGFLVVAAPRPWPWGLKAWGWGCSARYWRKHLQNSGWHIQQKTSVGGTPNWLQWAELGAVQIWVCTKRSAPPLNFIKPPLNTMISGDYQAKASHFQG